MSNADSILISLEPRHASKIYAGVKKVELRRRQLHVEPGTTVWIYEKLPIGSITGRATVTEVCVGTPARLWNRFGSVSGITRREFFDYFDDVKSACAVVLDEAQSVETPLSLKYLREIAAGFQPPQFFARLDSRHPVQLAVEACS